VTLIIVFSVLIMYIDEVNITLDTQIEILSCLKLITVRVRAGTFVYIFVRVRVSSIDMLAQ
jgi:hypothetical protein